MIGKVVKPGKSFGGCILYNINKHQAVILEACGVRIDKAEHAINDFNMQRKMNPELGQAVGHIALSWSPNDRGKLTPEIMASHAKEYMEKMKITDTQYLIMEHMDRPHPHVHIVYNRVNNDAKTISDKFQKRRNVTVCKELTLKYGYYMAQGKQQVNLQRLKGADKLKYELYGAISQAARHARSWQQLETKLYSMGIVLQYKFKGDTNEVQGISFAKGEMKFKGSEIDRNLSYGKLNIQIERNQKQFQGWVQQLSVRKAPSNTAHRSPSVSRGDNLTVELLNTLIDHTPGYEPFDPFKPKKKRKQNKGLSI